MSALVEVNYWAEGPTDRAAARRLIRSAGANPGTDYALRRGASPGKDFLDRRLAAFNSAARFAPWLVLRDGDGACAVELAALLLASPSAGMRLRIVVPAMEAWLIADRDAFATYLGVRVGALPAVPEEHADLKALLIRASADSRKRDMREDLTPAPRSGRREGPGYAARLIEFIEGDWSPERASSRSPSLRRALQRTKELVNAFGTS